MPQGSSPQAATPLLTARGITKTFDRTRALSGASLELLEVGAKVLIFDEPTASLSPGEVERLFDIMDRLRASGHGLLFVSHRLEEVFTITDRVTVMREGRNVLSGTPTAQLTQADLIRAMVGADIGTIYTRASGTKDTSEQLPAVLSVRHLASHPAVRDVSFDVHAGEILGLGGLVGAGRSETVEAIFGLRGRTAGKVMLDGRALPPDNPQGAIRAGLGFVAEDRRTQNIVPDLSVKENLLLAHLGAHRGFFRSYASRTAKIVELLARLGLPQDRLADASMLNFSGGMQQKIIMARWLLLEPKVLMLDEPTKGVDIGTRASIYAMLRDIVRDGTSIVVVSSDFEELLGLCDRVVVMSDGHSIADLPSALLDEEKLTLLAAPRTSMERNTRLLDTLATEYQGAGFWALIEGDSLICLNAVVHNPALDPGFAAGGVCALADTAIPHALAALGEGFVAEPGQGRMTLLSPMRSARGHDLGWVGLCVPQAVHLPNPDSIKAQVDSLAVHI